MITERDEAALKHLIDLRIEHIYVEDADEKKCKYGYKILFEFSPNEFFEDKILEKSYFYDREIDFTGEFNYNYVTGCTIKWKDDKDLTKEFEIKKQRNKNTNRTRLVRKSKPVDSFFNFFTPPIRPDDDEDSESDAELEVKIGEDFVIGDDLKEKVIPRAIEYFTGKALQYEVEEEDDFDDEDEDEDDDDQDDSGSGSEQDSGSDSYVAGHGGGNVPQKVRHSSNQNAEECKQQ
jgi:nucleosome assembly protein 1-like 1